MHLMLLLWGLLLSVSAAHAQQASYLREKSFDLPPRDAGLTVKDPLALTVDDQDRIHVLDGEGKVAVFSGEGELLHTYGMSELKRPVAIVAGEAGRMLILDGNRKQVVTYDAAGQLLGTFGRGGSHAGEFRDPIDMARGPQGLLHILDKGRKGVQIFSSTGLFIREVAPADLLAEPTALAVTPDGMIYISDKALQRRFYQLPSYNAVPWTGPLPGSCAKSVMLRGGELEDVADMVSSDCGTLFLLDRKTGKLWCRCPLDEAPAGASDYVYGGLGDAFGSFDEAIGLAWVSGDELLILDRKVRKVERIRITLEGAPSVPESMRVAITACYALPGKIEAVLEAIDCGEDGVRSFCFADEKVILAHPVRTTEFATSSGHLAQAYEPDMGALAAEYRDQLESVGSVAVNEAWLVVSDPSKDRIVVYERPTGMLIATLGDGYRDDRRFDDPRGVAIARSGYIVVADRNTNHVRIVSPDLASVNSIEFPRPVGVACDDQDNTYVWSEDGTGLSVIPPSRDRVEPILSPAFPTTLAGLTFDPAGNFVVLNRESQRILIIDPAGQEVIFAFGPERVYGEPGGLLADDRGNIYVTDRKERCTHVYHWSATLPTPDRFSVVYDVGGANVLWDACPGRHVTGYEVYGYHNPEGTGPDSLLYRGHDHRIHVPLAESAGTTLAALRVAAVGLGGMPGKPSRPVALPGLLALGPDCAEDIANAADWAQQTLTQLASEGSDAFNAAPEVRDRLRLVLFLAAAEGGDAAEVVATGTPLQGSVADAQRVRYGIVMTRAHLALGEPNAAADILLEVANANLPCAALADPALTGATQAVYDSAMAAGDTATAAVFIRTFADAISPDCVELRAHYDEHVALLDLRAFLAEPLAHWRAEEFSGAADCLGQMVVRDADRLTPEQRIILYQFLGACFYRQGDEDRARQEYQKIFVLDPTFRLESTLELLQRVASEPIYDPDMRAFFSELAVN